MAYNRKAVSDAFCKYNETKYMKIISAIDCKYNLILDISKSATSFK